MTATMTIYPHALDVESHTSVLRSLTYWAPTPGEKHTVKYRRLDTEHLEIEFAYTISTPDPVMRWTHVFDYEDLAVYRVTDIRQGPVSVNNGLNTAVISLELDALASWYVSTANPTHVMNGRWSRLPMQAVVEPFQIRPAQMMRAGTQSLARNIPSISGINGNPDPEGSILWCEVSFINSSGNFDKHGIFTMNGNINDRNVGNPQYPIQIFPSIGQIMNDPVRYMGVPTASSIVSVNVSVRCPYKVSVGSQGGYPTPLLTRASDDAVMFADVVTYSDPNPTSVWQNVVYSTSKISQAKTETMTGSITLTEDQIMVGQVKLYDVCNNMIGAIDTRYAVNDNGTMKINYTLRTQSNLNGMYTRMTLADGTEIRFPEGTIPYTGSAYQEYAIAQMAYDRELLAMNQEKVMVDTALNLTSSIANGAIASISSAGLGAGTAAVGIAGNVAGAYMEYQHNQRTQEAKENLMRNTPDTLYSTVSGTDYIDRWFQSLVPGYAAVNMPNGVASTEIDDYIARHGYPVTDVPLTIPKAQLTAASEGFLQGELTGTDNPIMIYGERRRILERQLRAGMHFKVIT